MSNQDTPRTRALALFKRFSGDPGYREQLFLDIAKEIEAENEACAKIADEESEGNRGYDDTRMYAAEAIAEKIRARMPLADR